jgi:hypothetical protein
MFHSSDLVAVYFDKYAVLQQAIFGVSSLNRYFAVKAINLLHFSNDEVPFVEVVTHVHLVFFDFSALDTSW